jgi:integrase
MTTYKRGRTWTYHVNVIVNGKREQHKRGGFPTQADALRAERAKLTELDGGVRLGAARMSLRDYLTTWLERYARSGSVKVTSAVTAASYLNVHVVPRLGEVTLRDLSRLHVEQLAADLVGVGLSPKTVRNVIGTLHKALRDGVRLGLLPYNVASDVTLPKYVRPEPQPWTDLQVAQFLAHADAHDERLAAGWWLALTCGLRRGELCGLRWRDVDLVAGQISVRVTRLQNRHGVFDSTPKSRRSQRAVALPPGALDALARLRDLHDDMRAQFGAWDHDLVLVAFDGSPLRPATLTRHWHQAVKAAGLPAMRLHDARHTHGTHLADLGVPVHAIQARLGHASAATTMQFYVHPGAAADRNAAHLVGDALAQLGSNLVIKRHKHDVAQPTQQPANRANSTLRKRGTRRDSGPGRDRTYDQGIMSPLL